MLDRNNRKIFLRAGDRARRPRSEHYTLIFLGVPGLGLGGNRSGRWPFSVEVNAVCDYRRVAWWDRWVRGVMSVGEVAAARSSLRCDAAISGVAAT
ncbi:jg11623 [Pararge aegeria aegeria]|uniref:Jg11623 protein n=1 Tax=Pararge aegeria aegeria TaxID=348720 RepID=A0A8S4QCC4_9NEOP|nr:jg11623 [Pararge aegeria aegeria]